MADEKQSLLQKLAFSKKNPADFGVSFVVLGNRRNEPSVTDYLGEHWTEGSKNPGSMSGKKFHLSQLLRETMVNVIIAEMIRSTVVVNSDDNGF